MLCRVQLDISARNARTAVIVVIVSFTSLSFVCVNLRDLRENMPFEHVKNGVMNRKQQNGRSRVSRGNILQVRAESSSLLECYAECS